MGLEKINLLANFPEGNPTQQAWDIPGRRVGAQNMPPKTMSWCQALLAVRGENTYY